MPTTPNPTGGYFVIVPRAHVIELEMTVDEALKYVISMGVVAPPRRVGAPRGRAVGPSAVTRAATACQSLQESLHR